jgi:hypothetical protein
MSRYVPLRKGTHPFGIPERSQGAQECAPFPKRLQSMEELQFARIEGRGEIFQVYHVLIALHVLSIQLGEAR